MRCASSAARCAQRMPCVELEPRPIGAEDLARRSGRRRNLRSIEGLGARVHIRGGRSPSFRMRDVAAIRLCGRIVAIRRATLRAPLAPTRTRDRRRRRRARRAGVTRAASSIDGRRRAGDHVEPPAASDHRVSELLPPARADRRVGREVIADDEQPMRLLLRRARLFPEGRGGVRALTARAPAPWTRRRARARNGAMRSSQRIPQCRRALRAAKRITGDSVFGSAKSRRPTATAMIAVELTAGQSVLKYSRAGISRTPKASRYCGATTIGYATIHTAATPPTPQRVPTTKSTRHHACRDHRVPHALPRVARIDQHLWGDGVDRAHAAHTARGAEAARIAPSHRCPRTTGTNSPAMSASPAAAGSVMNANPSTTPRK